MTLLRAGRTTLLPVETVMIGTEFYYLNDIPVRYELHIFDHWMLHPDKRASNDNERKPQC